MRIYKTLRPFNHIFGGDRILRAWYRGIKNAGPRKRAQGRAQDIPYQSISPYHHGIWRIFVECGKKPHARKSAQGRSARGPILPKSNRNFRQPPYTSPMEHMGNAKLNPNSHGPTVQVAVVVVVAAAVPIAEEDLRASRSVVNGGNHSIAKRFWSWYVVWWYMICMYLFVVFV